MSYNNFYSIDKLRPYIIYYKHYLKKDKKRRRGNNNRKFKIKTKNYILEREFTPCSKMWRRVLFHF